MTPPRICVVGSINMDLVVQTPRIPVPGETIIGGPFATHPGGKGANQAVAAGRAGASVVMIGCVGDDEFGRELRAGLDEEGLDTTHVHVAPGVASGIALIAVDAQGQNTIIVAPGANGALSRDDVRDADPAITAADVLLLQLEVPLPVVEQAARLAHHAGVTVMLNPAPAQPLPPDLLALCDYLTPNETEAEALTGILPTDWDTAAQAARRLVDMGASSVIVTLGSRGALLLHEGMVQRQPAFTVNVIDTTAAGDAFVGAFATAIGRGLPAPAALQRAAAAGALATTVPGARPSLPRATAIDALIESLKTRGEEDPPGRP